MALSLGLDVASPCGKCGQPLPDGDQFCPACGADRHLESRIKALEVTRLARARQWILWVGILYLIGAAIGYMALQKLAVAPSAIVFALWANVGLAVVHVGLYAWAKTATLAAAVVALILFLSVHVANAVLDRSSISSGIVVKVIFVVVLAKAIQAGYEIQRLRGERR